MRLRVGLLCIFLCSIQPIRSRPGGPKQRLLYIMLDGFRYDYTDDQSERELPGFKRLLREGLRAQWMTPIYPTLSYPCWTSLSTGRYAESHGIVGNYFYDPEDKTTFELFDQAKTSMRKWWTSEPVWITATKQGVKTASFLWSRCDISFDGVTISHCEPFVKILGHEIFRQNIDKAIIKLEEGYEFVLVYNEHMDNIGHNIGPETEERKIGTRDLDRTIVHLLDSLDRNGLADIVNIIIVSDHGMVTTAPGTVRRIEMDDYLRKDLVEKNTEHGALTNIKAKQGRVEDIMATLRTMPGVEVYRHDEIPEELHYKNSKYIHDILVKAKIGTWIMGSNGTNQVPQRDHKYVYMGAHGFDNMEEKMRAIFFAKGPAFKADYVAKPINSVDVYQAVANVLNIDPMPHNGTCENVMEMFVAPMICGSPGDNLMNLLQISTVALVSRMFVLFVYH